MPASPELTVLIVLDMAMAIGVGWSVWKLRSDDADRRGRATAIVVLGFAAVLLMACIAFCPEFVIAAVLTAAIVLVYHLLLAAANRMWK